MSLSYFEKSRKIMSFLLSSLFLSSSKRTPNWPVFVCLFFRSKKQKVRYKAASCLPRGHISPHTPRPPPSQRDFLSCLHFPIFTPFPLSQAQGTDLRSSSAFASGESPAQAGRQQWPPASPLPPKSDTEASTLQS